MKTATLLITVLSGCFPALGCTGLRIQSGANGFMWAPPIVGSIDDLGSIQDLGLASTEDSASYRREISVSRDTTPLRFVAHSCGPQQTRSITLKFSSAGQTVEVVVSVAVISPGIEAIEFEGRNVQVASLSLAPWPASSKAELIAVPFYSESVTYLPLIGKFENSYFDWQHSNATRVDGNRAIYQPITNGQRQPLKERLFLKESGNFDTVLPDIPNPKSPFISELAGRLVLDIWGPTFDQITSTINRLHQAGLENCVAIIHVWQKYGYDNGLPTHYPANTGLGGDDKLREAVLAGNQAGCYTALHQNYVDYYPNSDDFHWSEVSLDSNGKPQTAWYNATTKIQSFATKPTAFVTNAESQSAEIQHRYNTTASFIDVNSAVPPGWRADMDRAEPNAGKLVGFLEGSKGLWNLERRVNRGPVFGEGNKHWFWSGLLDGVEAQFGAADIQMPSAQQPLFVNFDLLKIHPLQVNQGMGYYSRWETKASPIKQSDALDTYRMQEIIYGHSPYIGPELWDSTYQVITEQNLLGPVSARYGSQTVKSIRYQLNDTWSSTNEAIKAKDWSRPMVTYSNDETVVANGRSELLVWDGIDIPLHGWAAKGAGVVAYTALVDGQIADYAETPNSYFANARNQMDLAEDGALAEPSVGTFTQRGPRRMAFKIQWNIKSHTTKEDLTLLVHFVPLQSVGNEKNGIAWQLDTSPATVTSKWRPGESFAESELEAVIPPNVKDGDYCMLAGLYSPKTGQRATLAGRSDGGLRYILGTVRVAGSGTSITFEKQTRVPLPADPRLNSSGRPLNFGVVRTDGMVSMKLEGSTWHLHTYPSSRDVLVQLDSKRFNEPKDLSCDQMADASRLVRVGNFWQIHVRNAKICTFQER